jgi:hypothetical protein
MHFLGLLTILAALTLGVSSTPLSLRAVCPVCTPSATSCSYYSCLESQYHCGPDGYPIGYGLKFCSAFDAHASDFSAEGQQWINATKLCLQQKLQPDAQCNSTCSQVHDDAFAAHAGCYVDNGVCTLGPSDWLALEQTVGFKALFGSWDAIKQIFEAASGCVQLWGWLLVHVFEGDLAD